MRVAKKKSEINVSDKFEAIVEGIRNNTIESADLTAAGKCFFSSSSSKIIKTK